MKVAHLIRIAGEGFADMLPALRQTFNERSDDDDLRSVFGSRPRTAITVASVLAIGIGLLLNEWLDDLLVSPWVNWSVATVAIGFAIPVRRYLFDSGKASNEDFAWLIAVVIPAAIAVAIFAFLQQMLTGDSQPIADAPLWTGLGAILIWIANGLIDGAAVMLAFCALCYSRHWLRAAKDVVALMFLLNMIIWLFVTILLEIGIVDRIVSAIVEGILHIDIPDWAGDLADQISYAGLVLSMALAIIGSTWTVCRQSFDELLTAGDIDIARTVRAMIDPPNPKKAAKKAAKAERKARKKAKKEARRREKI